MNAKHVLQLFAESGALLEGHFLLSSGNHSDRYLQCALVTQHPRLAARLGAALAEPFRDKDVQAVIGPAVGGILVAQEAARALAGDAGATRSLFCERQDGVMTLRRGFAVSPGERILAVEDVITTGGSVQEAVDLVRRLGGEIVGVGCFIDRSPVPPDFGASLHALARVEARIYPPADCPLCRQGLPLVKPGSRGLK